MTNPNDPATELTKIEYMATHIATGYAVDANLSGDEIARYSVGTAKELIEQLNKAQ